MCRKMILALSVENTNLVMGCFDGEKLLFTSRIAADRNKTGDEYAISFKSILDMHGIDRSGITGSIVASVVPALIREIVAALRLMLGKEPLLVGPGVKTGLNILSDNPASLGSDLVVNAVAAIAEYPALDFVQSFQPVMLYLVGYLIGHCGSCGAFTGRIHESIRRRVANLLHEAQRFFKVRFRFAREANYYIRGQFYLRYLCPELLYFFYIFFPRIAAVHELEYPAAAGLDRKMYVLAHPWQFRHSVYKP